ncbi:TPA: PAS domain-containing protein [Yersinia enterocolitica]|uniref:PAS domain-containing protein n=1 Tax=Yersinia enterocolitica TaxID=630 RepID=UPI0032F867FD|nr:PAS domain-containing protein [Yersinia enterocolitica]EKN4811486.1 PAS domain-containing protein [Yersinia enterocolitica]HDL7329862.1 PAS domain-containing protein [Yersinia enterocolitica]HDL7356237.1 PAS domain-containing protein [Yersinia enterocolitica]HDL7956013.1 PAS domain-containing protein [Yersinia enterocolitica]
MCKNNQHLRLPDEIPPQLRLLWDSSDEAWGFKDLDSRYLHANIPFLELLNLSPKFSIKGLSDGDLPHPSFTKFSSQFRKQEQQTAITKKRTSSIEIHYFGREQKLQPYLFDKFPLLNSKKECLGIIFHGKKMDLLASEQYMNQELPFTLSLEKPDDFFTDEEFDVLFYLLQNASNKTISHRLALSEQKVEGYRSEIYLKARSYSFYDFKNFCKKNGYSHYVPQKFLEPSSIIIPNSEWNIDNTERAVEKN